MVFNFDLGNSKSQSEGQVPFDCDISKMVTDRVNIITAVEYEVAYGLSISIFRFNYGLIYRSRLCTCARIRII